MSTTNHLNLGDIQRIMPQQPPFLFVEEAELEPVEGTAVGHYLIRGDEDFLRGHFRHSPVFPASVLLEALGQLGVLFLLSGGLKGLKRPASPEAVYFTSCNGVRCVRVCRPGDKLDLTVKLKRLRHPLVVFEGTIMCGNEKVATADEITLIFDYAREAPAETAQAD